MKKIFVFAIAAMLLAGPFTAGGDQPPAKQLQFHIRVYQGDPLGSREAGTLKLLAEPQLAAFEKKSFSFLLGGEVPFVEDGCTHFIPFGLSIEAEAGSIRDGKVPFAITLSRSKAVENTAERVEVHAETTQARCIVKLGEVVKFKWGKADADQQLWAEVTIEEVKP